MHNRRRLNAAFALALAAVTFAACQRDPAPAAPEPAEAPSRPSEPTAAEPDAAPPEPAPEPIPLAPAVRPDPIAQHLPPGDVVAIVDVTALRAFAAANGLPNTDDRAGALLAERSNALFAARDTPRALTLAPETTAWAASWSATHTSVVTDAPVGAPADRPDDASYRVTAGTPPQEALPLPDALPSDALLTVGVRSLDALPEGLRTGLDFLEPLEPTALWLAVRVDGSAVLLLDTPDPDGFLGTLGRGQVWLSHVLGQARGEASPVLQGWIGYANRASQALFAFLTVTATEGRVTVEVPAPACGGALRSLGALASVLTIADLAAADPAVRSVPFVPMEGAIADDCGALPGPAPTLPSALGELGGAADTPAALLVVDLGASLRATLPTGFGLLPFALSPAALDEAFGARPMGLSGLDAADAHVAYSLTLSASPSQALVVPPSLLSAAGDAPLGDMQVSRTIAGVGWATPDATLASRFTTESPAFWAERIGDVAGANAALVLSPGVIRGWATLLPADARLRPILMDSRGAVVSIGDGGVSVFFAGPNPLTGPEAAAALADALAFTTQSTVNSELASGRMEAARAAIDAMDVRADESGITATVRDGLLPIVAATLRVGTPLLLHSDVNPIQFPPPGVRILPGR